MNYKSQKWKNKRKAILLRDKYLCRNCQRFGKMNEAVIVHHIIPTEIKPEYFLNDENLISLCFSCHEKMHDKKMNVLSELGIEWAERKRKDIERCSERNKFST